MSTLSINLPNSVRERMETLAKEDGVSLDHYVAAVLAQRAAVAEADSYIRKRAARASSGQLAALLAKAPDVPPEPGDEVP